MVSGKGGTGKSLVSASLAALLARRGRTLLLDADLGVANAHLLQDVTPEHHLVDVIEGKVSMEDAVARCSEQLDLLAGGSGFGRVAHLSHLELEMLSRGLERIERRYEYCLVDSAAGLSDQTVGLAAAADLVVMVTTPDITSLTDAYAFLKVLVQRSPARQPFIVVNRVQEAADAASATKRMSHVAEKFLGQQPQFAAHLPEDRAAYRCTQRRKPVVVAEPQSPLAGGLRSLAADVLAELDGLEPQGLGRTLAQRLGS